MNSTQKVLRLLERGCVLTQWDMKMLGTIRLGGIIFALRQRGHKIVTRIGHRNTAYYSMKKARRR